MLLDLDGLGNRFAERPAAVFPGETLRFSDLAQRVRERARALARQGVAAGDRVALACGRDADTLVALLAAFERGCALLPLGADEPQQARRRLVEAFRARWLLEEGKVRPGVAVPAPAGAAVLALASSGSTGTPKLALVSAEQLRARIELQARCHGVGEGDRSLVVFPLHHAGGVHLLVASVCLGASLVFAANAHPRTVLRACAEHGVTLLPGPATLFGLLVAGRRERGASLAGLRFARSTAANLPLETHRAFTEAFGVPLWQSYGASESGAICSNRTGAAWEGRLALGAPPAGVELRVCDAAGGELPDGEVGELVVRSPGVALGYEGDAAGAVAGSRIRDGTFFSGDLGQRVNGLFYFRGRSKLLINVGGHKVDPLAVEEVLARHPAVRDVAVVATPVAHRDVVKALVVVGEPISADALLDSWSHALAPHEVPRFVEFRDELPRSALGKLQRDRL